jgi:hypothetical protein
MGARHVQQVSGKRALRFHLAIAADFAAFAKAMSRDLTSVEFYETGDEAAPALAEHA